MLSRSLRAAAAVLVLSLGSGGCVVLSSRYEAKSREVDSLRDAVAMTNREKAAAASRIEALQRSLDEEKKRTESLSAIIRDQEASLRKTGDDLAAARKSYEGTRITREQLVAELMEKEKATGKRIQEFGAKLLQCEAETDKLRRDAARREGEVVELRKRAEKPCAEEALRRERDILLGRVERLTEERGREERRRNDRFEALARGLDNGASGAKATALGGALRVVLPEKLIAPRGKSGLPDAGKAVVAEVGRAAAEFPASSVVVTAGSRNTAAEIKTLLAQRADIPEGRVAADVRDGERGAELILLVP